MCVWKVKAWTRIFSLFLMRFIRNLKLLKRVLYKYIFQLFADIKISFMKLHSICDIKVFQNFDLYRMIYPIITFYINNDMNSTEQGKIMVNMQFVNRQTR